MDAAGERASGRARASPSGKREGGDPGGGHANANDGARGRVGRTWGREEKGEKEEKGEGREDASEKRELELGDRGG